MKKYLTLTLSALAFLALSACEATKEDLGLTRKSPDEFAVVKRAPLAMPPDYSLRPPRPGAPRPQEARSEDAARGVIFGDAAASSNTAPATGESILLQQAGAQNVPADIRARVDYETSVLEPKEVPVAEKLLGWGGRDKPPPATVVDAKAEAERLQKNMDEGKPVTEGETPTIEQ